MKREETPGGAMAAGKSVLGGLSAPSLQIPLEPRFMYDAAGGATAAAVAKAADAPAPPPAERAAAETAAPADRAATQDTHPAQADHAEAPADVGPFGSKAEMQLEAAAGGAAPIREIVFVDARLPEADTLKAQPGVQVVMLDPARDGLAQVSEALAAHKGDLSAIHFVGHGESGAFGVGATTLDAAMLAAKAGEIAQWGAALQADGDIMIWGCDVASLPAGQALIGTLSALTGADVAASTDTTGAMARGGDWRLEAASGVIETLAPFSAASLAAWNHVLDTPTITGTADVIRVAEPSALNAPGASLGSLAGWDFTSANVADQFTVRATVSDTSVGTLENGSGLGSAIAGGWTFTGTLAQANAWLDQMRFSAADVERGAASGTTSLVLQITNDTDIAHPASSRTIAIEVTPSNDPVLVADSTMSVVEGASGTVVPVSALPAVDPEVSVGSQNATQIVYRLDANPVHGYLTLGGARIGAGSVFTQQDVIDGRLVYVHTASGADQNASDSFSVLVNDGATPIARSDSATVTIAITPVNQAPTVSGGGIVYEGQPANATDGGVPQSIVGNFITAAGGGDPTDTDATLSVRLTALTQHGQLFFTGTALVNGVAQSFTNHLISQADIDAGFVFAYAARAGLTYANDGIDDPVTRRPPADSFGVEVTDGGGGTSPSAPLSTAGTIAITVRAVNDEPVWVETSTRAASVDPSFMVQLDASMLNVADVDSDARNITFRLTSQAGLDQGRLVFDTGSSQAFIPNGGTFTLADVLAGRVYYYQMTSAAPGDTDSFTFQVLDNAISPHWEADGTQFQRVSGVYTGATPGDTLRTFQFTIALQPTPAGTGLGAGLPDLGLVASQNSSDYAGTDPAGITQGTLDEGGTVYLTDGSGTNPGLSYTVDGVEPEQVVYTVLAFDGGDFASWNGQLQKRVNGGWVTLGLYDTFTQADLNASDVRFVHDGGEDFQSSVRLSASAGVLVDDGAGGLRPDAWETDFVFYVRPVNDAPAAQGSTTNVLDEGGTFYITTGQLGFGDPDDASSESYLETGGTLAGGGDNYAFNNGALLTFTVTSLPVHGTLEYFDGSAWQTVTTGTLLQADWLTADAGTTRLRYVHDGGESSLDGFQVRATDRWGATSNLASVGFVVTPLNDPPQIASDPTQADPTGVIPASGAAGTGANEPLTIVYEGSFERITSSMLQAVDPDSSNVQVQYRITGAPLHGRIAYSTDGVSFATIAVGSSFSQADVDAGYIFYLHNGDEPTSTGYPSAPDDRFSFTLSDGAAEQTGREFWIYVKPANDAPVVSGPSGTIDSTDTTQAIPGFSVADPDLVAIIPGYETDAIEVIVRLLHADGTAFAAGEYADVTIGYDAASGVIVDAARNGAADYLVLRGTRDVVNAALAGLSVGFATDRDQTYQVQVVADDRIRNADGSLRDFDAATPGIQADANGGGMRNQPAELLTGTATAIPTTELDYYADAVPTTGLLIGNISAASVTIRASAVNDPGVLTADNPAQVYEDQATNIGAQIGFHISDAESAAFGTPITVTLAVPSGTLNVGTSLPAGLESVGGRNTGTLTLTGLASSIEAFLNSSLTYKSAANVNHDLNGAAAGDVTLTVSFDDSGSRIGSGGASANPPDIAVALTIIPVNDAPTVSGGGAVLPLTGTTPVPGFVVGDIDVAVDGGPAGATAGETDILQVTVRITNAAGTPLAASAYTDGATDFITLGSTGPLGALVLDGANDGTGAALVLRGTLADINAYLAGLTVQMSGPLTNSDALYRVEVIADDRVRDPATGALTGFAANGGENNLSSGGTASVPVGAFDIYGDTAGTIVGNFAQNVQVAARSILPTSVNDPAHIDVPTQTQNEGASTYQLTGISITDADALSDTLDVTVTLDPGFTFAASSGVTAGATTATFSGTLAALNTFVNSLKVNLPTTDGLATDWNGAFGVRIVVVDNGNNGGRPADLTGAGDTDDTTANPGDFSYQDGVSNILVTTRDITVSIVAVNDAPVVDASGGTREHMPSINEGTSAASLNGETVSTLFASYFTDTADGITGGSSQDAFIGVLVTGLSVNANQGVWQYAIAGGPWTAIGNRSDANALYLRADSLLRFVPSTDFHGTPNVLTVRLVENDVSGDLANPTAPVNGTASNVTGATGGSTRYSAGTVTLDIHVDNVNDRPSVSNGTLPTVVEDTANPPGRTVSQLFGGSFSDATDNQSAAPIGGENAAGSLGGIAIVGNGATSGEGRWQYFSGTVWTDIPASGLSDGNALVLSSSTLIRFLPAADFNGTPGALSVRASDEAVTGPGFLDISGAVNDGAASASHWSTAVSLGTTVSPVNDAPVLSGTTLDGVSVSVTENAGVGTGTSSATLLSGSGLSDVDLTTTPGLASGVFGAGRIEITLDAYVTGDRLEVTGLPPGVTVSATDNGIGRALVIQLDADTTLAEVEAILNAVTFRNAGDNPTAFGTATTRTYHVVVRDGVNTDPQGDTAGTGGSLASNILTGTIRIAPVNDPPVAENNVDAVTEDGGPATGNVITGGSPLDSDPDTLVADLFLTAISNGTDTVTPTGGEMVVVGKYGTLTIRTDGSYSYALDPTNPTVNALKTGDSLSDEQFTYTLSDPEGATDTATLTITINGRTDGAPGVSPVDGNGAAQGQNSVSEAGLASGSTPAATTETVAGTVAVTAADGLFSLTVSDGVDETLVLDLAGLSGLSTTPLTLTTDKGILTLTGFASSTSVGGVPVAGTLSYTYLLTTPQDHSGGAVTDAFALTVRDAGGATNAGALTILITNDAPTARADVTAIDEDGAASVSGNVFGGAGAGAGDVADTIGADGAAVPGPVTGLRFGSTLGTVGSALTTAYGSIVLNADGTYTYTLDNNNAAVNALQTGGTLQDVIRYTITDADGDTSETTLTITINGHSDGAGSSIVAVDANASAAGQNTVAESGLPGGTLAAGTGETTTGEIDVTAPDGLASVTIDGTTFSLADLLALSGASAPIATAKGALTVTGFTTVSQVGGVPTRATITYSYTLGGREDHAGGAVSDGIALRVDDAGGTFATGTLTILITDDAPIARNDAAAITEGAVSVGGNVFGNTGAGTGDVADTIGADGAAAGGAVTAVAFGATAGTVGGALTLDYGALTLNADGSYSYALDNTNAAVRALKTGQTLTETVTYTITDADGDLATATLTITINGRTDGAPTIIADDLNGTVTGENTVFEAGLVDSSGTEATTGTIAVSAPDGLASVTVGGETLTLAELAALSPTAPRNITTPDGTLALTGFTPSTSVGGVPTAGTLAYSYTLTGARNQPGASQSLDVIALAVADAGGDTSTGTLTITIVDHAPTAADDTADITEDAVPGRVSGNVILANDSAGADGFPSSGGLTGIVSGGDPKAVGTVFDMTYGTLVLNADGSYVYTLNNAHPAVTAMRDGDTLTETVGYTITDADGDMSAATLTITIHGRNDAPVVTPGDHVVGREDQPLVFRPADFAATDAEGDAPQAIRITTLPVRGTLYFDGNPVPAGFVVTIADLTAGRLLYRPAPDGNGVGYAGFTFEVSDGKAFSQPGGMRIDIIPVNDAPLADGPASAVARQDTPLVFNGGSGTDQAPRLSFDDIVDRLGSGYTDAFTLTLSVQNGTLTIGDPSGSVSGEGSASTLTLTGTRDALNQALATLTYVATPGFSGADQLVLTVNDHVNAGTGPDAGPSTAFHVTDIIITPKPPPLTGTARGNTDAAYIDLPGYDRWGVMAGFAPYAVRPVEDGVAYIEGWPVHRYTTTWQGISQQVMFRYSGDMNTSNLFYEAMLGRNQALPSWIWFDPYTQTVLALPPDNVEPGVYMVRVIARDSSGHEAESTVTIHVLQDNAKSLQATRLKVPPPDATAPPPEPAEIRRERETVPAPEEGAEPEAPPSAAPNQEGRAQSPQHHGQVFGRIESDRLRQIPEQIRHSDVTSMLLIGNTGDESRVLESSIVPYNSESSEINRSLTKTLFSSGAVGQMIESARLLEALASDVRPSP